MSETVLYISPNGYLGGAERFILNACLGHLQFGHYHPHILFFNDGEFVEMVKKLDIPHTVIKNKFRLSSPLKLYRATREISKIIEKVRPKVINATMPYSQIVLNLCPKENTIVNVWFQHGPVGGKLDKLCAKLKVDHIFFNTDYLRKLHYATAEQRKPQLGDSILHYGIETKPGNAEMVQQIRNNYLQSDKGLLMIAAGRICEWKGYHTIIQALKNIWEASPEKLKSHKFILVGDVKRESDRAYMYRLKEMAKELVECGVFEFVPFKENLNDYFKASNIFIHSSTTPEPFGLVVAEAMTQDTLVIGGANGGVTEVLKEGETGLTFEGHTELATKQLEEILEKVLTSFYTDPKYSQMIAQAKALILNEFSIPLMVENLERKYGELVKEKNN